MVPIKSKLYYAEMPDHNRPSIRGAGDPSIGLRRFSSRHSSEKERAKESPGRTMVNMIAQGGQRAANAIDRSYRQYKKNE